MATKITPSGLQTVQDKPFLPDKSPAQLQCEANGGKWDTANNVCIMPTKPRKAEIIEKPSATEPTTFPQKSPEKEPELKPDEEQTGIVETSLPGLSYRLPDGTLYSGLNTDDIAQLEKTAAIQTAQLQRERDVEIGKERQRLIAEETPQRRELSPELSWAEKVPVLGGVLGTMSDFVRPLKKKLGFKTFEQLPPKEEINLALTEIQRQEIERGLTASETFGKVIESVGLSKLDVFGLSAKDLIETPSENAVEAGKNIKKERRRITNIETNVKLGYLPVEVARDQIEDIEENVVRLASRVGFLVSQSPELKFNSDFVNTMETDILATEEKIFQAKQNILTGASIDPTEVMILEKLQFLSIGEEE